MSGSRISFCLPAHNEEQTLPQAVNSILNSEAWQTATTRELVVCVNGSTDRTWEVATHLTERIPEMRCIRSDKASKGAAWNRLVLECSSTSDFLVFLDADVVATNDTITKLISHLETNSNLDLVGARTTPAIRKYSIIHGLFAELLGHQVLIERHMRGQFISGCCYAIRAVATKEVRLPEEAIAGDDLALNCIFFSKRLLLKDAIAYFMPPDFWDRIKVCIRHTRTRHLFRTCYPHLLKGVQFSNAGPNKNGLFWDFLRLPMKLKVAALINHLAVWIGIMWGTITLHRFDPSKTWRRTDSTKVPLT